MPLRVQYRCLILTLHKALFIKCLGKSPQCVIKEHLVIVWCAQKELDENL